MVGAGAGRVGCTPGVKVVNGVNGIETKAAWDAFLAALDDTTIVITYAIIFYENFVKCYKDIALYPKVACKNSIS